MDKALVAFGGKPGRDIKFILKDLTKEEHYTMTMFVRDRRFLVFDFHLTREGHTKAYEPIVRLEYDTKQWESITEDQVEAILNKSMKVIDLEEPGPSLAKARFLSMSGPLIEGFRKGGRMEINDPEGVLKFGDIGVGINAFVASKENTAVLVRDGKSELEFVFRVGNDIVIFDMDAFMNGVLKLLGLDGIEKAFAQALKERKGKANG
jgi:hypothetical protein